MRKLYNNSKQYLSKHYYLAYSLLFLIVCLLVFVWQIAFDKTFIWYYDGGKQHFPALAYYGKYLRSIVSSLFTEGKLVIPDYDYSMGEGSDILSTLHYYVIGEPINLLSIFVPEAYTHYLYTALILIRFYLCGVSFSVLCFKTGHDNKIAIMAGALSYDFCYWSLYKGQRHPYFTTPMIYLPLLILGIEYVFKKKKPHLLIFTVTLAALSNFYFFYMLVIIVIVYCIIRAINIYKNNVKEIFLAALRVALPALLGVINASIIFIPIVNTFLSDNRMGSRNKWYFLYSLKYYSALPSNLISSTQNHHLFLFLSPLVILAILLLVKNRKQDTLLKCLLAACGFVIIFPFCGQVLNGMTYRSNRWCFSMILLTCYILVHYWGKLKSLTQKDFKYLLVCITIWFSLCMFLEKSRTTNTFAALCFILVTLCFLYCLSADNKWKEKGMFISAIIAIIAVSFWTYSPVGLDIASEAIDVVDIDKYTSENETAVMSAVTDDTNLRYASDSSLYNASMLSDYSSEQYYFSLSNPYFSALSYDLGLSYWQRYCITGYERRTTLMALASTKYLITKSSKSSTKPYGYSQIKSINLGEEEIAKEIETLTKELGTAPSDEQISTIEKACNNIYYVYKNKNYLPLGYCYDSYISEEEWNTLSAVEKQEVMLSTVYLSEDSTVCSKGSPETDVEKLDYKVECTSPNITFDNGKIVTTETNQSIKLIFNSKEDAETYVTLNGLFYSGSCTYDLYFGDDEYDPKNLFTKTRWDLLTKSEKEEIRKEKIEWNTQKYVDIKIKTSVGTEQNLPYRTPEYNFYGNVHDYTINMGYSQKDIEYVTITFPHKGIYTFSALEVSRVPMENYSEKIANLKETSLKKIAKDVDCFSGTINAKENKILCIALPYSKGWKAYLDNNEVPIMVANGHYIGIDIPKGAHKVVLRYSTPYKKTGFAATLIGFAISILVIIYYRRKNRLASKSEL